MLTPDYLDHAPDRLVLLWQQVEDDILRDVARRIRKMETLTPTANWQLWRYQQVEAVRQDVVKKLARYTGKSESENTAAHAASRYPGHGSRGRRSTTTTD